MMRVRHAVDVGAVVLVLGLILVSHAQFQLAGPAIALSLGLVVLVGLGPERAGAAALVLGLFLAPWDNVRPAGVITFSDLFIAVGFLALIPTLLQRKAELPKLYATGALLVLAASLAASALGPDPASSMAVMLRLVAAAIVLPTAMAWWRPRLRTLDLLAAAYVAGQLVSLGNALLAGPLVNGRYAGLSTHVNYFGQSGMLAFALCLHLFHRTTGALRLMVVGAAGLCGWSVLLSGSRAAAIVVVLLVVVYPLLERNALTAGAVLLLGALSVPIASWALGTVGDDSPISRLTGDETTSHSDTSREEKLGESFARWLANPVLGDGYSNAPLEAHNIYLQVAVVSGAIGLVGFLMILWALVRPLFDVAHPARRLCYAAFGYAALGMLTNSLWDRFTWTVLMLGFVANFAYSRDGLPRDRADAEPTEASR